MIVTIIIAEQASPVERYAAEEFKKYLSILYHIDATLRDEYPASLHGPTIVIGHPRSHPCLADTEWPSLSADGFCLKTVCSGPAVLVVAGGSGRGTLFGVYELLERWGVRFLLSGDVLPEQPEPFRLTGFDERVEPAYPIRAMRPLNNLPEGSAPWDLPDFIRFIDQMAKLKFNTYVFAIMESGPWLDYEFRGMKRPAGDIFYGYRFPIADDFIGKELFAGRSEFYNPILAKAHNEEERKQLGIGLVRSIIHHCQSRDLLCLLTFGLLEPPTAFKHKCNEWASLPLPDPKSFAGALFGVTPVEESGINPQYAAWMNVKDPVVRELTALRVKTLIDTYPGADYYFLWVSEHRAGVVDYRAVFQELDAKYHFTAGFDIEKVLNHSGDFAYGPERYQHQIKGDLFFCWLFDQIFREGNLLEQTRKPQATIGLAGVMPELAPLVAKMLPEGCLFAEFLEYGTHATADRIDDLIPVLRAKIPTTLEIGIQDDNTMWFPQINVESLQRIIQTTAPLEMGGYVAAIWQVRQADINAAYLGRASWQPGLTADDFYKDYLPRLVGSDAAADFQQALQTIEKVDREVKKCLYSFAFSFEGAMENKLKGVDQEAIDRIRPQLERAAAQLRRAGLKASERGIGYVDFWLKRTQFAIQWLDLGVAGASLGRTLGEARPLSAALTAEQKQNALALTDKLITDAKALIEIIVSDAKHIGDLGQIACLNRYVHRYLNELRADLVAQDLKNQ